MSLKQLFVYTCLILALNWTFTAAETPVRQCANESNPLPLMVQINDCDELPCDLTKGEEATIAIQFVATRNSMRQLTARVHLTSLGVTIPYELDSERGNVCQNLLHGAYCPLDAGEDVTYRLMLPVASNQPEVPTRLQVTLYDAENVDQVVSCFLADTRIKKSSS
ncbi:NPC intracellular cholesterol transporter 2 [Drosophila nasuta]|uniref:NPC intracellular cholesterol transporter 2 n=1 Tax=Drosophila nasuta TaxID=42062 RepID=UPI00295EA758|nr:NPC intracellular cholesterol transporter 2 [Drosophila nasuta]